jgi:ferrous iron transport protein B
MSCGARLPVYIVFISIFFHNYGGTVLLGLYVLGIAIAVISGLLLKKTMFKGETPMFIMELPPYRLPKMKSLMIHTWEKGKHFLTKAGTYILAVSIFVWFLLNLPWGVEDKKDSILGQTGQVIAPVMEPLGFGNWEASSALLTGVIAKEIVIGTMAEIYVNEMPEETSELSFTEDVKSIGTNLGTAFYNAGSNVVSTFGVATLSIEGMGAQKSLKNVILKNYTPLTALAFMTFVLLYMPCVITGIAMRQEFGTWKWYAISLFNGFAAAWIVSFAVFQVGSFLGIGV